MGKLFIARHGETEWNKESRLQGWKNAPLTEKGIKQAKALKSRLRDVDFDLVYSSPIGRTIKTANIILKDRDIELVKDERIKEINMGKWEGRTTEEIKKKFPKVYEDFWKRPDEYEPIAGESFYDVKERTTSFLEEILEVNKDENILVVSHGCASKLMMSYFEERPLRKLWKPPELEEGCLNIVELDGENHEILEFGDTSFR